MNGKGKGGLNAKFFLCAALVLCLISMIGASLIQTQNHKIRIKQMTWETPAGHQISADLWIPENATAQSPAPAIVTIEGWYNNKEMQDLYTLELARRGYVVLTMDLHGHGNSESLPQDQLYEGAVGVDGAVQLIASLPYVDTERIGVTGHSSGGTAANMALPTDNEREKPLIAAILHQAADWQDDTGGDHSGEYGSRSVGIIASEYDDFYFGTYAEDGSMLTTPREFMQTEGAKRFLNFNEDVSTFEGEAQANTFYERTIDGKDAKRIIYRPTCIHPAVTFSSECVGYAVEFFETVFGAPNPLPATDQVWQWKTAFNALGLVGFFVFLASFPLCMLNTQYFGSLKTEAAVTAAPIKGGAGTAWFWGTIVASMLFSGISYLYVMRHVYSTTTEIFPQTAPLSIGVWSLACGIFSILLMTAYYQFYGKKNGFSLKDTGVLISLKQLWKTLVLAVLAVYCAFGLVFFANYFFQTDFRIWVLGIKVFNADKVLIALRYLPFFLVFYVVNSISINCFNYNRIGGETGNAMLMGFTNCFACIVIVAAQYIGFYSTGEPFWGLTEGERILAIWLFPVIFFLFITAIMTRIVYKKTHNPYLAGFINAMVIVMISCSNTFTSLSAGNLIATTF